MTGGAPLRILGIDGRTGRPLDPLPEAVARRWAERALRRARPPRYGVASDDLRCSGWGLVLPEGADTAVRDALGPLLARRRQQAGDRYRELTYRPGEGTADFRSRLRAGMGRVDPRQIPWYLLLVGDPAALPYGFELDLGVPHAVGRLAFDEVEDLAAYARRAADAEESQAARPPRAAVFAPTHPDDPSTPACARHLARPLARLLQQRKLCCSAVIGRRATRRRLLELIDAEPDLLVTAAHSVVFPPDDEYQRPLQGAVVCADWPGRVRWQGPIPPEHTIAAEDLPTGVLGGGMAVLFGCHTTGTPRLDVFGGERREEARQLTSCPFVAALAQRLLGRHGGALAVLGHVGKAYEASFVWRGVRQIAPLEDALQAVLDGRRLGEAIDGFGQRFADLAVLWARSKMDADGAVPDPLALWTAFHDARSWSLLGDPAIRLPVATPAP